MTIAWLSSTFIFSFWAVRGIVFEQPSFVSDWRIIRSQSNLYSDVTFHHELNVLPYKVVTEVMVESNQQKYTFKAMGSSYRDDDYWTPYGGIVYVYNETVIRVMAPNKNDGSNTGVVIYTGNSDAWEGPNNVERSFKEGMVRVKIWLPCDFPEPTFVHDWTPIDVNDKIHFKEVSHSFGRYPDLVVVQVKGVDTYVTEAEGSTSRLTTKSHFHHFGGVLYGFSRQAFRIWYPTASTLGYNKTIFLYGYRDGWGNNDIGNAANGYFRILAWFGFDQCTEILTSPPSREETLPYNMNNDTYLTVEVESLDGPNSGFRFYGVGSTVNNGEMGDFGGLLYAYSDMKVVFWIPKAVNGHIINIGGVYNSMYNQASNNVNIRIKMFTFSFQGQCCKADDASFPNTQVVVLGYRYRDAATYECDYGYNYTDGDMYRTCMINGTWNGTDPVCTKVKCPSDMEVNGAILSWTGFEFDDNITYQCSPKTVHSGGDLFRHCTGNGTWSGMEPICTEVRCPSDIEVNGTNVTWTGFELDDNITNQCPPRTVHSGGDLIRRCTVNGTWSGMEPICTEVRCPSDIEVNGTNVTWTGFGLDDSITYQCFPKTVHSKGDLHRRCTVNGTWSGMKPICTEVRCPTGNLNIDHIAVNVTGNGLYDRATYTYNQQYATYVNGNLERTCQENGTWSGIKPNFNICLCPCRLINITSEQRQEQFVKALRELKVSKKMLSKAKRALISVEDDRTSAVAIGYLGLTLIVLTILILILPDVLSVSMYLLEKLQRFSNNSR